MILSRYSWTTYVALWFFVISSKLWERESLLQKRNKYNFLIFCFLFLKISLIVLLELKTFSCDFGIGACILCCCLIAKLSDSVTPWTAVRQDSLSFTFSRSLLKLFSMILSNHLVLCRPLLLLPSIFASSRVFFNESGSL